MNDFDIDPRIISWKRPGVFHRIVDGKIIKGPSVDPLIYAQWKTEWDALPADDAVKDPRANKLKRLRAAKTVDDLIAIIQELI